MRYGLGRYFVVKDAVGISLAGMTRYLSNIDVFRLDRLRRFLGAVLQDGNHVVNDGNQPVNRFLTRVADNASIYSL